MSELETLASEISSTLTKRRILLYLFEHGDGYGSSIAKVVSKDKSTVSRHLKALERIDLLKWNRGKLDRRKKIYSLTEKGRAICRLVSE